MKILLSVPLIVFFVIAGFLARGLFLDPTELPSPFIGKPAPEFRLPQLQSPNVQFNSADMIGQVWLLNIWASWCAACRVEHPLFNELSTSNLLPIVGLNYKDKPDEALEWLEQLGNPYSIIATDTDGRVGIEWGVYGVPETFVIDRKGIVRYKHIGPVDRQSLDVNILPLILKLQQSQP